MNASSLRPPPLTPSLGELMGKLAKESETLVRQELTLATKEMSAKALVFATQALNIVVAVIVGGVSLTVLAAALVIGLATWMPTWFASLLVAAVYGLSAYALYQHGMMRIRQINLQPTATIQTLQENKSWAQALVR